MRKKRLIIGLFTVALVAAAVPVASAATSSSTAARSGPCHTWQYYLAPGAWTLYSGRVHYVGSRTTVINVHSFYRSGGYGDMYEKRGSGRSVHWVRVPSNSSNATTVDFKNLKATGKGKYLRCW